MKVPEFIQEVVEAREFNAANIARRLFPFASWAPHYNKKWLMGDVVAGLTIGILIVPQALAYAQLATVPLQYGLYSSFVGTALYCFFGTSRDISMGPSAVLSLYIGITLDSLVAKGLDPVQCAITMSFFSGCILLGMGILKLGIILDLISIPVTKGFTAGAAVTIFFSQIPSLLGMAGVKAQGPLIDVLRAIISALGRTRWQDALVGFSGIAMMMILKRLANRFSHVHPAIKMIGIGRTAIVVIIYTLLAFIVFKAQGSGVITVVGNIPKGFPNPAIPRLDSGFASEVIVPAAVAVLVAVMEHISGARTYARLNHYKVDSSQEMLALGVCNIANSFFSAYPVTGALSRSAVISQSGVKTPASGILSSLIVMLSINFLPPVLYYVPKATLASVIIVNIIPLICGYKVYRELWRIQKTDTLACLLAFLVTIFTNIQTGIGVAAGFSLIVSLHRIARPKWQMLGQAVDDTDIYVDRWSSDWATYPAPPGVVIFRFSESITFLNGEYFKNKVLNATYFATDPSEKIAASWSERNWSDDRDARIRRGPDKKFFDKGFPTLRAVILDFSGVNHVDYAGLQWLLDLKAQLSDYAGNRGFELHFVGLKSNVLRR
ncbi:sulfate permease, partial [Basidiobolus meristosporus CBS 931.73]